MSRIRTMRLRLVMASIIALAIMFSIVVVNATRIEPVYVDMDEIEDAIEEQYYEHSLSVSTAYEAPLQAIEYNEVEVNETLTNSVVEEEQCPYTPDEVVAVARVLSGECYDDELDDKRNVVWVICNRVTDGRFGDGIIGVITEPNQFMGYWAQGRGISESDMAIAEEVLAAYFDGEEPVHDYLYFTGGTGKTNTFSHTW